MSILRADSIRDRAGTGAPNFPNGISVSNGINATGVITATSFSGAVTGNVTGNVSGTSAGLTGTPSIIVQDATVQGDLTVNGTTSTIDTVITAVDSLNVEGNVGIGTDNPSARLDVEGNQSDTDTVSGNSVFDIAHFNVSGATNQAVRFYHDDTNNVSYLHRADNGGDLAFSLRNGGTNTERVRITAAGTAIFKGGLAEKVNIKSQLTGANACAITDGNVILTTTNEPGNTYPNITGVHSTLAVGEGFSVTIALKVNGSGTINGFYIDGVSQTIGWSGGSAPSAGASGHDVFTFTAMKTGSGTTDYTVFGAATNYA